MGGSCPPPARGTHASRRVQAPPLTGGGQEGANAVDWSTVDFVDLGCSSGGSVAYCKERFKAARGIGVDADVAKIEKAREAGIEALWADATRLELTPPVRFISMMHFLEHLPDLSTVTAVIEAAARSARDFLFIQHPSFEGEDYLAGLGLRQCWWYWSGHPTHITIADYCRILDSLSLRQYAIRYQDPVDDSSDSTVLPASVPKNQHRYDPDLHGPKPMVEFRRPIWKSQEIFIALRPMDRQEWLDITSPPQWPR